MSLDSEDKYLNALDAYEKYPTNLCGSRDFITNVTRYRELLNLGSLLFNVQDEPIEFMEMLHGDDFFEAAITTDIKAHFTLARPDPKCRFVFIHGNSSNSRLACSKGQLKYMLSFLQVQPYFLDFIFPSGGLPSNLSYNAAFRQNDAVLSPYELREPVPRLGRAGSSITHSYLLHSPSLAANSDSPWSIRQTAIYHSFDLQTGKSLWIVSRGEKPLRDRLQRMAVQIDSPLADDFADPATTFRSSLRVDQQVFEWSTDTWRNYIGQHEQGLEQIRTQAIADHLGERPETTSGLSGSNSYGNTVYGGPYEGLSCISTLPGEICLVTLYDVQTKMRDACHMLEQNSIVLDALALHYRQVMDYEEFPSRMKDTAYHEILRFSECVTNIQAELAVQQRLAERLRSRVQTTISLLSSLSNHGAACTRSNFNQMPEFSSPEMKSTTSMRIISLVTLLYLPGMFLAMYFSSQPFDGTAAPQLMRPFQFILVSGLLVVAVGLLYMVYQVRRRIWFSRPEYYRGVKGEEKHGQAA